MACCSRDALIDHAMAEIEPAKERKDACRQDIEKALQIVDVVRMLDDAPTPGKFRERVKSLSDSLYKTRIALTQLSYAPAITSLIDKDRFLKDIERLILTCETTINGLQVSKGSRVWDAVKYTSALQASIILNEFAPSRRSLSKDGHFFRLASIIYEIASGEQEKDLSAYCENLDRVEPLYVVKIPNVLGS